MHFIMALLTHIHNVNRLLEECRRSYIYCCGVDLGKHEPMIACDNTACPLEWFQMKCVGLKTVPVRNYQINPNAFSF